MSDTLEAVPAIPSEIGATSRSPLSEFLSQLRRLSAGDTARLKRCAGKSLAESGRALGLFYRILPRNTRQDDVDTYFLIATLYALVDEETGSTSNFGQALQKARNASASNSFDRRVEILLDANNSQLAFRLRQTLRYLASKDVRVNWNSLSRDLMKWSHPDRVVQKRWAYAYFREAAQKR